MGGTILDALSIFSGDDKYAASVQERRIKNYIQQEPTATGKRHDNNFSSKWGWVFQKNYPPTFK